MSVLAEILSSRVRVEFFRLFFGLDSQDLHLREIERRSGFSIGAVRQEASKLVRNGLLLKRVDGNRTYYRANKDNNLYPDVHSLVMKTVGLSNIISRALEYADLQYAFVFGSAASANMRPESDIDLFVIGDVGLRYLSKQLIEATNLISREINIHAMPLKEFIAKKKSHEHFVTSILSSPKIMIIGKEDELARLV